MKITAGRIDAVKHNDVNSVINNTCHNPADVSGNVNVLPVN